MSDQIAIESPRLRTLHEALERGEAGELEAFWVEVQTQQTPLIEHEGGSDIRSLVTFLWRAREPIQGVRVIGYIFGKHDNEMTLLPNSDVWYRTCRLNNDVRATYQFMPVAAGAAADSPPRGFDAYVADPFNPLTYVFEKDEEDPDGFELVRSVLELPEAPPQPLNTPQSGVPAGTLALHRLRSEILGNERRIWIHTPAGYDPDREEGYPFVVLFDGTGFAKMSPTTTIFDHLIASGDVPPFVAIMPCSLSQTVRLKELILHAPFNEFVAQELLPWAHERFHLSEDPAQSIVAGASAGGLAAGYAAFEHPELFGNVLSMSGAFSFAPELLSRDWEGEHEWLARQVASTERKPIRFFLSSGTLENKSILELHGAPNGLVSNRHLRTILQTKGYECWLHEFAGAHDMISWQGVLPIGLKTLLQE